MLDGVLTSKVVMNTPILGDYLQWKAYDQVWDSEEMESLMADFENLRDAGSVSLEAALSLKEKVLACVKPLDPVSFRTQAVAYVAFSFFAFFFFGIVPGMVTTSILIKSFRWSWKMCEDSRELVDAVNNLVDILLRDQTAENRS